MIFNSHLLLPACLAFLLCAPASAELIGAVPGRSAKVPAHPTFSIELGASWYTRQLRWSSVRFNFKTGNNVLAYLDAAQLRAANLPLNRSEHANFSGLGYGGGLMFAVPDFLTTFNVAFKGAYHIATIEQTGSRSNTSDDTGSRFVNLMSDAGNQALHQSQWSAEFVLSPIDAVYENGVSWYATFGLVSTAAYIKPTVPTASTVASVGYRKKVGEAVGLGVIRPILRGQLFAGVAWLAGDPLVGFGVRRTF